MQKGIQYVQSYPILSDANGLGSFLRNLVSKLRKVAVSPDLMGRWIREATDVATVKDSYHYAKWFELLYKTGDGFERTDILLLDEIKRALKKSPHLLANIHPKEQEFLRVGHDFKGRQAVLMVREYYKASRSDTKRLDRSRVDNTRLRGDDVEGWSWPRLSSRICLATTTSATTWLGNSAIRNALRLQCTCGIWY